MLNYDEVTGTMRRIGVISGSEQEAIDFAEETTGGKYAWTDSYEWGFEVVFENGYLI